jgi:hypothetical protein
MQMQGISLMFVFGVLLIALNELTTERKSQVVVKYIPRDMDTYFRDPENQPSAVFKSIFEDNIRF